MEFFKELGEIVASLVQPFLNLTKMLFTGKLGISSIFALVATVALQTACTTTAFSMPVLAVVVTVAALTLVQAFSAFWIFSIGLGAAFSPPSQTKIHTTKDYLIAGYIVSAVNGLICGAVIFGVVSVFAPAGALIANKLLGTLGAIATSALLGAAIVTPTTVLSLKALEKKSQRK